MIAPNRDIKKIIIGFQKNEITEYFIYRALLAMMRNEHNRDVLRRISEEEMRHYHIWHKYSGKKIRPDNLKRWFYIIISLLFGVSFCIKLMEKGESNAQAAYGRISDAVPEAGEIKKQEEEHEARLIDMIEEEKLEYMGSVVLGLNDALVEFTGALAGFTFALQDSRLIGMVGLIMGFSASLSMAASEYLSTKTESTDKNPLKASFYTGVTYLLTVIVLVFPYFILGDYGLSLFLMIALAVALIFMFTFYYSVVRDIPFGERFTEMLGISMGVAALSFVIGIIVKKVLQIDI